MQRFSAVLVFVSCLGVAALGCLPATTSEGTEGSGSGGATGSGGKASSGGNSGSGGAGGATGSGGKSNSGGSSGTGGMTESGGAGGASGGGEAGGGADGGTGGGGRSSGGASGSGGKSSGGASGGAGGAAGSGGASSSGGSAGGGAGSGGRTGNGGRTGSGGATATGGIAPMGGTPAGGSTGSGNCSITVKSGAPSDKMQTVGVVEWATTLTNVSSAQIVYTLNNAGASVLNKGGTAPVDLKKTNYRTLLLGLKPSSTYTYHIEATSSSGTTCKSADATLTTGTLSGAPTVTRTVANAAAQAAGFIVTSGGLGGGGMSSTGTYIFDADGTVVWYAAAPSQCSRAHMDYEGVNMWMLALNVGNTGGEMRFVSMDGQTSKTNINGLSAAHHDFTVLPGKIAAMVWTTAGARDPESNLVEIASDGSGSPTIVFKIGANLYAGGASAMGGSGNSYHCNYIVYHPGDDSYTISDRNPNLVVKVRHDGTPIWQIGGSCTSAKAPKCAAGTWQVNHGHDLDEKGNMLVFNNGQSGSAHVLLLKLTETASAISFATTKDFTASGSSSSLGDVQFLPNGNMLITVSNAGQIVEADSAWSTVQTIKGTFGYTDWRETLYGPPSRK
jgi:hypothetical protein